MEGEEGSAGDASTAVADKNDDISEFLATQMVDEAAMLASSTFPVSPETLIATTKRILAKNNGAEEPALLASDFVRVAPVVGPLGKEEFLKAFGASFKIEEGFPDAKFGYYAFRVDPFEPNRVWYDARFTGTNTEARRLARAHEQKSRRPPGVLDALQLRGGGHAAHRGLRNGQAAREHRRARRRLRYPLRHRVRAALPGGRSRGRRASSTTCSRRCPG